MKKCFYQTKENVIFMGKLTLILKQLPNKPKWEPPSINLLCYTIVRHRLHMQVGCQLKWLIHAQYNMGFSNFTEIMLTNIHRHIPTLIYNIPYSVEAFHIFYKYKS